MESKRYKATVQWFDEDTEKPLDLATYEFSWGPQTRWSKTPLEEAEMVAFDDCYDDYDEMVRYHQTYKILSVEEIAG